MFPAIAVALAVVILQLAIPRPAAGQTRFSSDLDVAFSVDDGGSRPGSIVGRVTNRSQRHYPCVELRFRLTRTVRERPAFVTVRVQNIAPRAVVPYRHALPYRSGISLAEVSSCRASPAPAPPPPPRRSDERHSGAPPPVVAPGPATPGTTTRQSHCSVFGRITGTPVRARTQLNGPLVTFELSLVEALVGAEREPRFRTGVNDRGYYRFQRLPAGQSIRIIPVGPLRYDRDGATVRCVGGKSLRLDIPIEGVMID
jgi:hypothetical protein